MNTAVSKANTYACSSATNISNIMIPTTKMRVAKNTATTTTTIQHRHCMLDTKSLTLKLKRAFSMSYRLMHALAIMR